MNTEQVVAAALTAVRGTRFCLDELPRQTDFDTHLAMRRAIDHLANAREALLHVQELLELVQVETD